MAARTPLVVGPNGQPQQLQAADGNIFLGQNNVISGTVDPSAGSGVAALEGSVYHRYTAGTGQIWLKVTTPDTGWRRISTARTVDFHTDGTVGVPIFTQIPFNFKILSWSLVADIPGSISIDIWKKAYASLPGTVADTIVAANYPAISSAIKNTDSTLTGWTTSGSSNDWLYFNVRSSSTLNYAHLQLVIYAV